MDALALISYNIQYGKQSIVKIYSLIHGAKDLAVFSANAVSLINREV
jgi:hypothetical protein